MNIEKIVEAHARKLKEEVGTALNGDECFDLINDAVTEALELVKSNSVLGDVRNTYQDGYRVGYLEATIEACKSILKK